MKKQCTEYGHQPHFPGPLLVDTTVEVVGRPLKTH